METLNISFKNSCKELLLEFLEQQKDSTVNAVKSYKIKETNSNSFFIEIKFTTRLNLWHTAYQWGFIQANKIAK